MTSASADKGEDNHNTDDDDNDDDDDDDNNNNRSISKVILHVISGQISFTTCVYLVYIKA
jgi:hypothetical protein